MLCNFKFSHFSKMIIAIVCIYYYVIFKFFSILMSSYCKFYKCFPKCYLLLNLYNFRKSFLNPLTCLSNGRVRSFLSDHWFTKHFISYSYKKLYFYSLFLAVLSFCIVIPKLRGNGNAGALCASSGLAVRQVGSASLQFTNRR